MRAIILAGGQGTRLKPYTAVLPKPLMPIGGVPILETLIRQLTEDGVKHITITLGYLGNLIRLYFGDGSQFGIKIDYSVESSPLGTMGPLNLISDLPENFLVLNGDVLTDLSFSNFYKKHCDLNATFSISSYLREVNSDFGVLEIDGAVGNGSLIGFKEKPKLPFEVSMGVYVVHRDVLSEIPMHQPFGFDQLMLKLLAKNQHPKVFRHTGIWLDIGRTDDFESAQSVYPKIRSNKSNHLTEAKEMSLDHHKLTEAALLFNE